MTRIKLSFLVLPGTAFTAGFPTACRDPESSPTPITAAASTVNPLPTMALSGPCTVPCHVIGTGIVEKWEASKHAGAVRIGKLFPFVLTPKNAPPGIGYCGNCHGNDAIERRMKGEFATVGDAGVSDFGSGHLNYAVPGTKTVSDVLTDPPDYVGTATSTQVHCTTCHQISHENDPHVTGVFKDLPLRVPYGEDHVFIEKSPAPDMPPEGGPPDPTAPLRAELVTGTRLPASYGPSNVCIFCHKSPYDVTFYVNDKAPVTALVPFWGPHEGTQADLFTGLGGYRYPGKTYDSSIHSLLSNGCSRCHMPPIAENNNIPDHSFNANLASCGSGTNCHTGQNTSFDLAIAPHTVGGVTTTLKLLDELRAYLCPPGSAAQTAPPGDRGACYLSRVQVDPPVVTPGLTAAEQADKQYQLDTTRVWLATPPAPPPYGPPLVSMSKVAIPLYNYLTVAKDRGKGSHNPIYIQQLLWDTIRDATGAPPASMPTRPTPLPPLPPQ